MLAGNSGINNITNESLINLFELDSNKACCILRIKICCDREVSDTLYNPNEICLEDKL